MKKLTDIQLNVLSNANAHEHGVGPLPPKIGRGAAAKVAASLVTRKLMREVRAKAGMPVWRKDEAGKSFGLVITRAGREAIGVGEDEKMPVTQTAKAPKTVRRSQDEMNAKEQPVRRLPRQGTKEAQVIAMLSANGGTTIEDLIETTGWLPHTTRAALTGLRKKGFAIERRKKHGVRGSIYRIVPPRQAA